MKKISVIGWITFALIYSISCNRGINKHAIIINPEKFIKKNIPISEIADSITYIPTGNQYPIAGFYELKMDAGYFYATTKIGVLIYNKKGSFQRKIGGRGRGPGEFTHGLYLAIGANHKNIFVLDQYKIVEYSFNGRLKKEVPLKGFGDPFCDIEYYAGRLYLFKDISMGHAECQWVVMDTTGHVLSTRPNPINTFPSRFGESASPYLFNHKLHYWNHYNDTIFEIGPNGVKAEYFFGQGNFRLPREKLLDSNPYFDVYNILESKNYLFIDYFMKGNNSLAIFSKGQKRFFLTSYTDNYEGKAFKFGIKNDLDGGLPFRPHKYFFINGKEYLLSWVNAFNIIQYVKTDAFKNATPKYPEKKKALKQMADSLTINDNPVLMLVKLKE